MVHEASSKCILFSAGATQAQKVVSVMNALESLSDWKDLDTVSMARHLMGMTAEARTELRSNYATTMRSKEKVTAAAQL